MQHCLANTGTQILQVNPCSCPNSPEPAQSDEVLVIRFPRRGSALKRGLLCFPLLLLCPRLGRARELREAGQLAAYPAPIARLGSRHVQPQHLRRSMAPAAYNKLSRLGHATCSLQGRFRLQLLYADDRRYCSVVYAFPPQSTMIPQAIRLWGNAINSLLVSEMLSF